MDFVVDRSKWRCGGYEVESHGLGNVNLLNMHGFMCCLGHCSKQLGCTDDDMRNTLMPSHMKSVATDKVPMFVSNDRCSTELAKSAAQINDCIHYSDEEREKALYDLFLRHGHTISFTGEYYAG